MGGPGRPPGGVPWDGSLNPADDRRRDGGCRADPDLPALHAAMPMIAQWDDHESANDCWDGGAQNHDAATAGDWHARRAASTPA